MENSTTLPEKCDKPCIVTFNSGTGAWLRCHLNQAQPKVHKIIWCKWSMLTHCSLKLNSSLYFSFSVFFFFLTFFLSFFEVYTFNIYFSAKCFHYFATVFQQAQLIQLQSLQCSSPGNWSMQQSLPLNARPTWSLRLRDAPQHSKRRLFTHFSSWPEAIMFHAWHGQFCTTFNDVAHND